MKKIAAVIAMASFAGLALFSSCIKSRNYTCKCLMIIHGGKLETESQKWTDVDEKNVKPVCDHLQELAQIRAEFIGGNGSIGKCDLYQ